MVFFAVNAIFALLRLRDEFHKYSKFIQTKLTKIEYKPPLSLQQKDGLQFLYFRISALSYLRQLCSVQIG